MLLSSFRFIKMKEEETPGLVLINKKERANGWSWPLHPYQLVAWFFLVSLPLVYYGALVPHLPKNVILAGCFVSLRIISQNIIRTLLFRVSYLVCVKILNS